MSKYPPPPAPASPPADRQQPPPPLVYGGGTAPSPVPRYRVEPQPPRRRHTGLIVLGVIVGMLVLLIAVAAAAGSTKNGTHVSKANHPVANGQPAAPAPARKPKGEQRFALGDTAEVTQDGKVAGTITVSDPKATQRAPDEYSRPPAKGWFVTLTVTAKATGSGTFDVNPFDFYVRGPDGQHYEYGDGNAAMAGGDGGLDAATLNPGETVKGTVTFDVPDQHGVLVYAPTLGRALGSWTF